MDKSSGDPVAKHTNIERLHVTRGAQIVYRHSWDTDATKTLTNAGWPTLETR